METKQQIREKNRATIANAFAQAYRERKVAALVAAFDQTIIEAHRNPFDETTARITVAQLESTQSRAQWAQVADSLGIRPPSRETIALVVDVYRKRAGGSR